MPFYDYRCVYCGYTFEEFQSMIDEPLKKCPICKHLIKRIIYSPAIIFKGSGFYKTDSKKETEE